jgi:hypothetical protein
MVSSRILDDDLLVMIGARANSVSYDSSMVEMPSYLQHYCAHNNILFIYPEQFGEEVAVTSFSDPLASDIATTPSPVLLKLRQRARRFAALVRRMFRQ